MREKRMVGTRVVGLCCGLLGRRRGRQLVVLLGGEMFRQDRQVVNGRRDRVEFRNDCHRNVIHDNYIMVVATDSRRNYQT